MNITLIQNPPYIVDFRQFIPGKEEVRAANIALSALQLVKDLFRSIGQAGYLTLSYSGVSFKHIVLGYYGNLADFRPPATIYFAIFKVAYWILGMGTSFVVTSYRLFMGKQPAASIPYISRFAGEEINIEHIRTKEIALNASAVPADVTVDQLAAMFEEINFTQANEPGYMTPLSRKEGNTTYTPGELKTSLDTFIDKVKRREAFLGTPPQYDTPRLMAYYQQIEDAVRLSIHKINQELREFQGEHGTVPANYNPAAMSKYKNILEERAQQLP